MTNFSKYWVTYGKVTRSSSDGADAAEWWGPGSQVPTRRMYPWGIRSVPPVGAECVAVSPDGSPQNALLIGAESTTRTAQGLRYTYGPTDMQEGETVLYDKSGSVIHLHADGSITVIPKAGAKVKLGAGDDVDLDQLVTKKDLNDRFVEVRDVFDNHTHPAGAPPTGLTAPPMGGPVTGTTAPPTAGFGSPPAVTGSPNVYAKKP